MKHIVSAVGIAATIFVTTLAAQDQIVTIETVPKRIEPPTNQNHESPKTLTQKDKLTVEFAPDLINKALGQTVDKNNERYYLIHMTTLDSQKVSFVSESWNTYQYDVEHPTFLEKASDPWTKWFNQKRIFGSPNAAIVYLHWVKTEETCKAFNQLVATLRKDPALQAEANPGSGTAPKHGDVKVPGEKKDFGDLLPQDCTLAPPGHAASTEADQFIEIRAQQIAFNWIYGRLVNGQNSNDVDGYTLIDAESASNLVFADGLLMAQTTVSFLNSISYKVAITKKIPTPLANLRDILTMTIVPANGATKLLKLKLEDYQPYAGGKTFQVEHLPSDMVVSADAADTSEDNGGGSSPKELSKNTWDNERRYPIDFSLALPLKSYKEATVDLTNGNITARQVTKERLAAMVDFSPWWFFDHRAGFETKSIASQLLPIIEGGIPIAGKALQHPILAAGIGLNKVHFFVGTQFNLNKLPGATTTGNADSSTVTLPPGPVTQKWGTQLVWGIDFSVQTITSLLKSNSK